MSFLLNSDAFIEQRFFTSATETSYVYQGGAIFPQIAGQLQQGDWLAGEEEQGAGMLLTRRSGKQPVTMNTFRLHWQLPSEPDQKLGQLLAH